VGEAVATVRGVSASEIEDATWITTDGVFRLAPDD
jgi:hypothetical protein